MDRAKKFLQDLAEILFHFRRALVQFRAVVGILLSIVGMLLYFWLWASHLTHLNQRNAPPKITGEVMLHKASVKRPNSWPAADPPSSSFP